MAKKTTSRTRKTDTAKKLAIAAARVALEDKCDDIIVLDLKGRSDVTDFFVIATGTSDRQLRAAADDINKHATDMGQPAWHIAGAEKADWIVLDFVDVVVHLFDQPHRKYYDLELIWGEAPRVRWKAPARRKTAPSGEQD